MNEDICRTREPRERLVIHVRGQRNDVSKAGGLDAGLCGWEQWAGTDEHKPRRRKATVQLLKRIKEGERRLPRAELAHRQNDCRPFPRPSAQLSGRLALFGSLVL